MTELRFDNREIDSKIAYQSKDLKQYIDTSLEKAMAPLITQVTYTNGKLRRMSSILTIIASVTATLLFTSGSELVNFVLKII